MTQSSATDKTAMDVSRSAANLLRLLKVEPNHRVFTRQDLTKDYDSVPVDPGRVRDVANDTVPINPYYTWNSPRTNAPIHKYAPTLIKFIPSYALRCSVKRSVYLGVFRLHNMSTTRFAAFGILSFIKFI